MTMLIDNKIQETKFHNFKNTVCKTHSPTKFNFNGDELELTERNRHLIFNRRRRR